MPKEITQEIIKKFVKEKPSSLFLAAAAKEVLLWKVMLCGIHYPK